MQPDCPGHCDKQTMPGIRLTISITYYWSLITKNSIALGGGRMGVFKFLFSYLCFFVHSKSSAMSRNNF